MNTYPKPIHEAPEVLHSELVSDLCDLLQTEHAKDLAPDEQIRISLQTGAKATWLKAQIGDEKSSHLFELFIRHSRPADLDGGLGLIIDYLNGVLTEFFAEGRNAFFPLDFTARDFENTTIWARHEFKRLDCEKKAQDLLASPRCNMFWYAE